MKPFHERRKTKQRGWGSRSKADTHVQYMAKGELWEILEGSGLRGNGKVFRVLGEHL